MLESSRQISAARKIRDRLASLAIGAAGGAVIVLILLILAYLLYVALPLAAPAKLQSSSTQELAFDGDLAVMTGDVILKIPDSVSARPGTLLSSGERAAYLSGDVLQVFDLVLPRAQSGSELGEARLRARVSAPDAVLDSMSIDSDAQRLMFSYADKNGLLHAGVLSYSVDQEPLLTRWSRPVGELLGGGLLVDAASGQVLLVNGGSYLRWHPERRGSQVVQQGSLLGVNSKTKLMAWGPDHETLLLVDFDNQLHRFDVARAAMPRLGDPQRMAMDVLWLGSESGRRVTYLVGAGGELVIQVPSSRELLLRQQVPELAGPGHLGIGTDGRFVYRLTKDTLVRVNVQNSFPETGWRSLWLPQWFGGYDEPGQYWHPDGGAIGALSKLSLSPLLYGTFKAALYGMLLAVPLSLGAAVYTGYFLPPRIRNRIKPSIEMLEAFPTVVLGFVAGLWLAPLLLDYLLPILLLPLVLLGLPILLALGHLFLQLLSPRFQRRPPRVALVFVAYLGALVVLMMNGDSLESWLFDESLRDWLWSEWGIAYEQRNALLVGMAMGIAITPVMFSIVEDSIFAVPRSLSDGSLALGATRWQSLSRVVLPAASPAILSALLIGLARGLGETMIVLLATGNTPLMDPGAFSGLRSFSASIVVELPEAGTQSVQFRLLFLAALVLFGLTFILNTIAELFRQRLRYVYAYR
ncbi:ABC transporter permease subunit [Congregibacter variabilis]|uniref:ABC transporter permease subunit n=1 Tax=Congregibacter variabilis TaxID=3081200 RepID=A0ABZ0I491_9GAMM|nr:ABC transporter permease subunit [Congregibacter sp. IMCC43200]